MDGEGRSSEVNEPHIWSTFGGAIDDEDELDLEKEVKREVLVFYK